MPSTNRTTYAILGLLADGPKSGYEIKRIVEKTISHFWKESYGHLYPTLRRLTTEGLVERQTSRERHSLEREQYRITAAGHNVLRAWLQAPVEPDGIRNELALKLYFGQHVSAEISRAHLQMHMTHHQQLLTQFAADQQDLELRAARGDLAARYELITLSLGKHVSQARIAWCDEALGYLDAGSSAGMEDNAS